MIKAWKYKLATIYKTADIMDLGTWGVGHLQANAEKSRDLNRKSPQPFFKCLPNVILALSRLGHLDFDLGYVVQSICRGLGKQGRQDRSCYS